MCQKGGSGSEVGGNGGSGSGATGSSGTAEPPILAIRPKLNFTRTLQGLCKDFTRTLQGLGKKIAKEGAEGMVLEEALPKSLGSNPLNYVEWLANSGASRHVCNDMSLLWDVIEREEPILLR